MKLRQKYAPSPDEHIHDDLDDDHDDDKMAHPSSGTWRQRQRITSSAGVDSSICRMSEADVTHLLQQLPKFEVERLA